MLDVDNRARVAIVVEAVAALYIHTGARIPDVVSVYFGDRPGYSSCIRQYEDRKNAKVRHSHWSRGILYCWLLGRRQSNLKGFL